MHSKKFSPSHKKFKETCSLSSSLVYLIQIFASKFLYALVEFTSPYKAWILQYYGQNVNPPSGSGKQSCVEGCCLILPLSRSTTRMFLAMFHIFTDKKAAGWKTVSASTSMQSHADDPSQWSLCSSSQTHRNKEQKKKKKNVDPKKHQSTTRKTGHSVEIWHKSLEVFQRCLFYM